MTKTVTSLHQLRAIRRLSQLSSEVSELRTLIRPALLHGSQAEREAAANEIARFGDQAAILSNMLAKSAFRTESGDLPPLVDQLKLAAVSLGGLLNSVGQAKNDDAVKGAIFDLLQSALALLWASGGAKSREITELAKACYSRKGWDELFQCRTAVAIAKKQGDHHAK
jgi:hypothetical protein